MHDTLCWEGIRKNRKLNELNRGHLWQMWILGSREPLMCASGRIYLWTVPVIHRVSFVCVCVCARACVCVCVCVWNMPTRHQRYVSSMAGRSNQLKLWYIYYYYHLADHTHWNCVTSIIIITWQITPTEIVLHLLLLSPGRSHQLKLCYIYYHYHLADHTDWNCVTSIIIITW